MLTQNISGKRTNSLFFLLTLLTYSSCSLNRTTNESTDYNEKNNFYSKKINQFTFILKPFGSEKLLDTNYDHNLGNQSETAKDSILNEYKEYMCFVFEIDIDGFHGDISDYEQHGKESDSEQRSNYYLFDMQHSFILVNEDSTEVPCQIYYYERLNEMAKINRFIVGFRNTKRRNVTFEYTNPYFNCGKIKFAINNQPLAYN